jgi:hypothetical protein
MHSGAYGGRAGRAGGKTLVGLLTVLFLIPHSFVFWFDSFFFFHFIYSRVPELGVWLLWGGVYGMMMDGMMDDCLRWLWFLGNRYEMCKY